MTGIFIEGSAINIGVTGSGGSGWSPIGAAFDADYTRGRYSDNGIVSTFGDLHSLTRASVKYAETISGSWVSFAPGVPAITDKGLLIEEARTNGVRNNTMAGAVVGSPGTTPTNWAMSVSPAGLTRTVVGFGTENGIDYVDIRLQGVPSSTGPNTIGADGPITASAGTIVTNTFFVALVGGSFTNTSAFALRAGSEGGTTHFVPDANLTRYLNTRTLTGTDQVPVLRWNHNDTVTAVDFTLRLGLPQSEVGAFATSPIKTSGSAAARAADVITAPGRFAPLAQNSFFVEYEDLLGAVGVGRVPFMNAASVNERHFVAAQASNKTEFINVAGGVSNVQNASSGNAAIGIAKVAGRASLNDCATQFNALLGGNLATDTVCAMPAGANSIYVGGSVSGISFLNGYLRRLIFFPRKLTDAELSALVAA